MYGAILVLRSLNSTMLLCLPLLLVTLLLENKHGWREVQKRGSSSCEWWGERISPWSHDERELQQNNKELFLHREVRALDGASTLEAIIHGVLYISLYLYPDTFNAWSEEGCCKFTTLMLGTLLLSWIPHVEPTYVWKVKQHLSNIRWKCLWLFCL